MCVLGLACNLCIVIVHTLCHLKIAYIITLSSQNSLHNYFTVTRLRWIWLPFVLCGFCVCVCVCVHLPFLSSFCPIFIFYLLIALPITRFFSPPKVNQTNKQKIFPSHCCNLCFHFSHFVFLYVYTFDKV